VHGFCVLPDLVLLLMMNGCLFRYLRDSASSKKDCFRFMAERINAEKGVGGTQQPLQPL